MSAPANARKSERLLNLLIMLLVQRRFVSKARIREILYPETSTEAFEKMFERDKEELRSLGVPIEVGSLDALFDEPGYRIRPDEFALPSISLAADEAAVVGLAAKVWEHARLADATTGALRKLTAAGLDPDVSALQIAETRLSADEPAFDDFWEATQCRVPVAFDYRGAGALRATRRHVQPWGVVRSSGRWYAVGWDTDRQAERIFRLSRVESAVSRDGEPGCYEVPSDADAAAITRRLAPPVQRVTLVVLVRAGSGHGLRRDAARQQLGVDGPDRTTGWDRLWVERGPNAADEVLSYGAAVFVETPETVRSEVQQRLADALGIDHAGAR
ncbi:MAG: helix-turn-helix transcriptional regulator [Nocardioides sp.]